MPTLTLPIPQSAWAKLEKVAKREGCTVRTLVIYAIRDTIADETLDPTPDQPLAPAAA